MIGLLIGVHYYFFTIGGLTTPSFGLGCGFAIGACEVSF